MKQFFLRTINNLNIKHKLILLYSATFLLPLVILSVLFISWLYKTLLNWERMRADTSFQRTESVFSDILTAASELSDRIYVNKPVQDIILKTFTNTKDIYTAYNSITFVDDFLRAYESIASIRLYTDNQTLLDNSFIIKTTGTIRQEPWYQTALRLKGHASWMYKRDSVTNKEYLSLVRSVWRTTDRSFIGVLSINMNPFYVNKMLNNQMFDTFIVYSNRIIYNTIEINDAVNTKKIISMTKIPDSIEANKIVINGSKSEAVVKQFRPYHSTADVFNIIYMIPIGRLTKTTYHITKLVIFILALCLILSSIMIYLFSLYFGKRVQKVRTGILRVVSNNFEIQKSIGGKDEFSEIYDALYEMSLNIKKLIKEVYIRDLEREQFLARQNDMRFKMLAAQINPHFLFNTLEHIRMKALAAEDKDVAYMLKLLAKILRYNLSVKGDCVPLISEIETVSNYLEIQHKRFANRISYDIMLLCDVRKIQILPLLIQPIVENSFTHGLESKTDGGFIYIEIKEEKENNKNLLFITVRDNGCGIPVKKVKEINSQLEKETVENSSSSIGMINVNQRIKIYYGTEYGIKIESTEDKGTSVYLKLPLIETNEIRQNDAQETQNPPENIKFLDKVTSKN
jgi:two-component system, sensor histidine kinase YesM